jgi:hypothetical protein
MNLEQAPSNTEVDYGYGCAVPDTESSKVDYGYGDAAPDIASEAACTEGRVPSRSRLGRRSSMKQQGVSRRASIGYTGEVSVNLPGQREPVRRRTSIAFEQYDEVKEVAPMKSLTDTPEKLWFQAEEYDMIRHKAVFLTDLAASGADELLAEKKLCIRGLESHIHSDLVKEEQYLAWKSVFLEQYLQRDKGDYNDEMVSSMYQMAAMPSQERAQQRAQQDSADAEMHTRSTRTRMRRQSMFT